MNQPSPSADQPPPQNQGPPPGPEQQANWQPPTSRREGVVSDPDRTTSPAPGQKKPDQQEQAAREKAENERTDSPAGESGTGR